MVGWIGATIDAAHDSRMARKEEKQMQREIARQYEFAQNTIQWKVDDAKEAGLHPLYALGASTQTPTVVRAGQRSPTNFGAAFGQMSRQSSTKDLQAAQIAALEAAGTKDMSISGFYDAREAEILNSGASKNDDQALEALDAVDHVPVEQKSVQELNKDTVAGQHGSMRAYTIYGGRMYLPDSGEGMGESLENVSWYLWPTIIQYNKDHLTPKEFANLKKLIPGYGPTKRAMQSMKHYLGRDMDWRFPSEKEKNPPTFKYNPRPGRSSSGRIRTKDF